MKCWGNNSSNQVAALGDSVYTPTVAFGIDGDAVQIPAGPGKVTGIKGVSSLKKNTVSFKSAAANGAEISKYEIKWKLSTSKKWSKWINLGKKTKTVIKGWAKGKKYQVQVRATNLAGSSLSSIVTITQTK